MPDRMHVRPSFSVFLVALLVVACDASIVPPASVAPVPTGLPVPAATAAGNSPASAATSASVSRPTSATSPTPLTGGPPPGPSSAPSSLPPPPPYVSPFPGDAYEEAVITDAADQFAASLVDWYDGAGSDLALHFTPEALTSAMALDWRFGGAIRGEITFDGAVSRRGFYTSTEEPQVNPPLLVTDVGFVVEAGARTVDVATGAILQRWPDRQYYGFAVTLRYDVAGRHWYATAVEASDSGVFDPPRRPAPGERCPGLDADLPGSADPEDRRQWCFGGADGILADRWTVSLYARVPCGESRAAVINLGWPVGQPRDNWDPHEYVFDPLGEFNARWGLPTAWRVDAHPPADLYSTGLTDGELEVWVSPRAGAHAIWMLHAGRFERWPRAGEWGVTDCN